MNEAFVRTFVNIIQTVVCYAKFGTKVGQYRNGNELAIGQRVGKATLLATFAFHALFKVRLQVLVVFSTVPEFGVALRWGASSWQYEIGA